MKFSIYNVTRSMKNVKVGLNYIWNNVFVVVKFYLIKLPKYTKIINEKKAQQLNSFNSMAIRAFEKYFENRTMEY